MKKKEEKKKKKLENKKIKIKRKEKEETRKVEKKTKEKSETTGSRSSRGPFLLEEARDRAKRSLSRGIPSPGLERNVSEVYNEW